VIYENVTVAVNGKNLTLFGCNITRKELRSILLFYRIIRMQEKPWTCTELKGHWRLFVLVSSFFIFFFFYVC